MNNRIYDPMNYKEACYYIAAINLGVNMNEYLSKKDVFELLSWLGSHCGESFLNRAKKIIDDYPYKEDCNYAIICGEVVNSCLVESHKKWIEERT